MRHALTRREGGGLLHDCACGWSGCPVLPLRLGRQSLSSLSALRRCPIAVVPQTEADAREELRLIRVNRRRVEGVRLGRNAPCPCGSGRKFKRCCGA